jgi:hypothetical protein
MPKIETVKYHGWKRNIRLSNGQVELIVTADIGPRILRFGFIGGENAFGELPKQMGGAGEKEWMIRGGHRLWVAPEAKPKTYELDNKPIAIKSISGGIRTVQAPGTLAHIRKTMDITLADRRNEVIIVHRLTNKGRKAVSLAPWALTVMAKRGTAIIPLPKKLSHAGLLINNQNWSLWGYTDLSDPRWMIGPRYIRFRQDPRRDANKLGIAHREEWVAYLRNGLLFIKKFKRLPGAVYPDCNVNFETFSNQDILELESLGPLVTLRPGQTVAHTEKWALHRGTKNCRTEADIDKHVGRLAKR